MQFLFHSTWNPPKQFLFFLSVCSFFISFFIYICAAFTNFTLQALFLYSKFCYISNFSLLSFLQKGFAQMCLFVFFFLSVFSFLISFFLNFYWCGIHKLLTSIYMSVLQNVLISQFSLVTFLKKGFVQMCLSVFFFLSVVSFIISFFSYIIFVQNSQASHINFYVRTAKYFNITIFFIDFSEKGFCANVSLCIFLFVCLFLNYFFL